MAELKTQPTDGDVTAFLNSIEDPQKREDAFAILEMMRDVTAAEPKMWGESIVGFGDYHYKYASGREGDWFQVGFSPRKQSMTLYLTYGIEEKTELMKDLGTYKTGKACLYVKRLSDVNRDTLKELVRSSVAEYQKGK